MGGLAQFTDHGGNAVVAQVDCHAGRTDRDPVDEQPPDAWFFCSSRSRRAATMPGAERRCIGQYQLNMPVRARCWGAGAGQSALPWKLDARVGEPDGDFDPRQAWLIQHER